MDAVGYFVEQWAHERPELDVSPMATIGRLSRMAAVVQTKLDAVFAEHDLQSWEFDVLASLRRSGEPYSLTAGELDRTMMITSGTTTHRITRLEARGFVERVRDEDDRRVVHVRLTDEGRRVCDVVQDAHMANERAILDLLGPADLERLRSGLEALAEALGDVPPAHPRR
ncbi:MarR family winged helix-turn-helix transcriptional regulator [Demequina sp. NBRC 110056]|uniref:MarR family winged helix-turn-helix transcriptional regulator n=1 Tax=Demequina sp. NBRC 110056 TaxID=1570345 RepID=UPI000A036094|nr:MarR family transcriptional regulator [Demequina sp. NBRC 110056]